LNQSALPVAQAHWRRQRPLALPGAFSKIGSKRRFCNSSPAKFAYRTAQTAVLLKNLLLSSTIGISNGGVSWAAMAKHEQEGNVLEVQKTRIKPPPLYKVILLNDDYTPMDFVVVVLQTVFAMSREKATQVMLQIHREGMGVCGTYTREVAAAKVDQVLGIARRHQHPLQCTMEET
jgi:ATP-dependent Clp protease adaptor protein ClpS